MKEFTGVKKVKRSWSVKLGSSGGSRNFSERISFPQWSAVSVPVEECVTSGNDGVRRGRRRDR